MGSSVRGWGLSFGAGGRGLRRSGVWVVSSPLCLGLSHPLCFCWLLLPPPPNHRPLPGQGSRRWGRGCPSLPEAGKRRAADPRRRAPVAAPRTGPSCQRRSLQHPQLTPQTRSWAFLLSPSASQTPPAPSSCLRSLGPLVPPPPPPVLLLPWETLMLLLSTFL